LPRDDAGESEARHEQQHFGFVRAFFSHTNSSAIDVPVRTWNHAALLCSSDGRATVFVIDVQIWITPAH
jgi:hypothetical protein